MNDSSAWVREEPPRVARLIVAEGEVAMRLVARLLTETDDALLKLSGVASTEAEPPLIVIHGATTDLPWVDGAEYFGEAAIGVYLPTTRRPPGPLDLQIRAARREVPSGPFAWLIDGRIIPLAQSRPLHRCRLEAWLAP